MFFLQEPYFPECGEPQREERVLEIDVAHGGEYGDVRRRNGDIAGKRFVRSEGCVEPSPSDDTQPV